MSILSPRFYEAVFKRYIYRFVVSYDDRSSIERRVNMHMMIEYFTWKNVIKYIVVNSINFIFSKKIIIAFFDCLVWRFIVFNYFFLFFKVSLYPLSNIIKLWKQFFIVFLEFGDDFIFWLLSWHRFEKMVKRSGKKYYFSCIILKINIVWNLFYRQESLERCIVQFHCLKDSHLRRNEQF